MPLLIFIGPVSISLKDHLKMKKNIALNLAKIGNEITVIFGKSDKNTNSICFEDGIHTELTQPFLAEYALLTEDSLQAPLLFGRIKITKEQMLYRLQGDFVFQPQLECVRSLTTFRQQLTAAMSCFFVPQNTQKSISKSRSQPVPPTEEIELSIEDLETYYYSGNQLILDECILDTLYCAIPELPLCRENCKGLCSECGEELNETDILGNKRDINHRKDCSHFANLIN